MHVVRILEHAWAFYLFEILGAVFTQFIIKKMIERVGRKTSNKHCDKLVAVVGVRLFASQSGVGCSNPYMTDQKR